jgi:hypothetical protein
VITARVVAQDTQPCSIALLNFSPRQTTMDKNKTIQRMSELMEPINQQIMMCDDRHDMLMIACAMLQRTREIFDAELGEQGRKLMFQELV